MAATADKKARERAADDFEFPVAASAVLFAGTIACVNASGLAVKGATSPTLKAVGLVAKGVDNSLGVAGAKRVSVRRGCFAFLNSAAADLITLADVGAAAYIVDDETVAKTSATSTRSIAGVIRDVNADGVWIEI